MTMPIQVDPLALPRGLSLAERIWWTEKAEAIRTLKALADEAFERGKAAHGKAEQARADYVRLQQENRARFKARGQDQVTADFHFAGYSVTQDCIDTDQLQSRWSQEEFTAANVLHQQVLGMMNELRDFMVARRPAPRPRGEAA